MPTLAEKGGGLQLDDSNKILGPLLLIYSVYNCRPHQTEGEIEGVESSSVSSEENLYNLEFEREIQILFR